MEEINDSPDFPFNLRIFGPVDFEYRTLYQSSFLNGKFLISPRVEFHASVLRSVLYFRFAVVNTIFHLLKVELLTYISLKAETRKLEILRILFSIQENQLSEIPQRFCGLSNPISFDEATEQKDGKKKSG